MKPRADKSENKAIAYERCIVCQHMTDVPQGRPIDLREYYVAGSGQLCRDCYFRAYRPLGRSYENEAVGRLLSTDDSAAES